jgi:hypothetical protein
MHLCRACTVNLVISRSGNKTVGQSNAKLKGVALVPLKTKGCRTNNDDIDRENTFRLAQQLAQSLLTEIKSQMSGEMKAGTDIRPYAKQYNLYSFITPTTHNSANNARDTQCTNNKETDGQARGYVCCSRAPVT